MDTGDDIPVPDWEASWREIQQRTAKKHWRLPFVFTWSSRRLATAAVTIAVVFVVGVLAGRALFSPGPGPSTPDIEQGFGGVASVAAYTATLEPLLIDFMNTRGGPVDEEVADLTRRVVADMLAQTRILKRAAYRNGDDTLYFLLDDVELVLISIANLGGQNGDVADQLDRVIKEKAIMTRLKQLPTENETI
jgi:hypothetical protein